MQSLPMQEVSMAYLPNLSRSQCQGQMRSRCPDSSLSFMLTAMVTDASIAFLAEHDKNYQKAVLEVHVAMVQLVMWISEAHFVGW